MNKTYIGIDNGVTGTITILRGQDVIHFPTPTKIEQSYTKTKQNISRIDVKELKETLEVPREVILESQKGEEFDEVLDIKSFCLIERPMINPLRWKASVSAIRALEATIIVLEELDIPYQYIDSKEWQKYFLPSGIVKDKKLKGNKKSSLLKKAAIDIAKRLFPKVKTKDADSLLIAEYARRKRY